MLYPTEDVQPYPSVSARQADSLTNANQSFGQAIEAWSRHQYKSAYRLFGEHIKTFPNSPWVAEALLHQGCEARYEGRMNEAEQTYLDIISTNQSKTSAGAKRLVNMLPHRQWLGYLAGQSDYDELLHEGYSALV